MILVTVTSDQDPAYIEYWFPESYFRYVTGNLLHMENEAREVIA